MEQRDRIIGMLKDKSVMKQVVFRNTMDVFELVREIIKEVSTDIQHEVSKADKRVTLSYSSRGEHEIEFKVAGDMLVFYMHTNVFEFDKSHPMYKTAYIKGDESNSYCGIIYVYNFLSDSFKFNRLGDMGYLIGRIFVNREKKFFMESRPPIGYKYSSFSQEEISRDVLKGIIYDLMMYAISFDLFTPPFELVKEVSVHEVVERVNSNNLKTGKRLGYRFNADSDDISFEL